MDPHHVVLIKDEDSDDELLCAAVATAQTVLQHGARVSGPLLPFDPQPTVLPHLQNGARFSGPVFPFEAIVSAANSSGIFNVGHTCNVAKRSTSGIMCRIECNKCDSRIILHLKDGLYWEVTQSGVCKKRTKRPPPPSPPRPLSPLNAAYAMQKFRPVIAAAKIIISAPGVWRVASQWMSSLCATSNLGAVG